MTERIDAFLERLGHLDVASLSALALAPVDEAEHDRLLDRVDAAAESAGRLDELDEAADRAQDALITALSRAAWDPTWFGPTLSPSLGWAEDRARLIGAAEDAAMAAVVADLAPDEAADLARPFELLASMSRPTLSVQGRSRATRQRNRWIWLGAVLMLVAVGFQQIYDLAWEIIREVWRSPWLI
jgi:hypothetical protein